MAYLFCNLIIKQDIRIYVTNSRPNGWTEWAEIFVDTQWFFFKIFLKCEFFSSTGNAGPFSYLSHITTRKVDGRSYLNSFFNCFDKYKSKQINLRNLRVFSFYYVRRRNDCGWNHSYKLKWLQERGAQSSKT